MVNFLIIMVLVIVRAALVTPLIIFPTATFGSLPPLLSCCREMISIYAHSTRYALKIFSIGLETPGPWEALRLWSSLSMDIILPCMYLCKCARNTKELEGSLALYIVLVFQLCDLGFEYMRRGRRHMCAAV